MYALDELVVLGRALGQNWVYVQWGDGPGWVSSKQVRLNVLLDSLPFVSFRPLTGLITEAGNLVGSGVLVVSPHLEKDYVVVLAQGQNTVAAVYLRAGEPYSLYHIPDGSYSLFLLTGQDWDGYEFTADANFDRARDEFKFDSSSTTNIGWRIYLNPTPVDPTDPDTDILETETAAASDVPPLVLAVHDE